MNETIFATKTVGLEKVLETVSPVMLYNAFRNRATEILSCSRYFATVRRAIL